MIFLHEIITTKLGINSEHVKMYYKFKSFEMDIRREKRKRISIIGGDGTKTPKVIVRYSRKYWYEGIKSIGVVGDLDTGSIYDKMVNYLKKYLGTKCKQHNVHPKLKILNSKKSLTMTFKDRVGVTIWAFEIPDSLEIQIARALKRKHPKLSSAGNEDEIIEAASKMLGIPKERVIRMSVSLLGKERWFIDLCRKLGASL